MFRAAIIVEVKWQVQKHADRPLRAGLTHLSHRLGITALLRIVAVHGVVFARSAPLSTYALAAAITVATIVVQVPLRRCSGLGNLRGEWGSRNSPAAIPAKREAASAVVSSGVQTRRRSSRSGWPSVSSHREQQCDCPNSDGRDKCDQQGLLVSFVDQDWVVRQVGDHDGSSLFAAQRHVAWPIAVTAITVRGSRGSSISTAHLRDHRSFGECSCRPIRRPRPTPPLF